MTATLAIDPRIEASWKRELAGEFAAPYFADLKRFLLAERDGGARFFPPGPQIFGAFDLTPFDAVRVVILGQDPYHGPGQAHGLAFSVPAGVALPPSLVNIFKELATDLGVPAPRHGSLESWARQGVLLLNATLTVRAHEAGSHQGKGWERFTDGAIRALAERRGGLVFLLWGRYARGKKPLIDERRHLVLEAPHPSPLSASYGFFGCRHFSRANAYLLDRGLAAIDWAI
ncbi:MAG: uracil-DNA glycosylase [Candidatus Sericytochromatia bacterium]|nr:uracil-DNA glycosylase [Candidatus Tanganyikabacteria bacterium]